MNPRRKYVNQNLNYERTDKGSTFMTDSPIERVRPETRTWLSPCTLVTMAAPRPVVTLTLMPPIMLQTMMYQSMLFVP